MSKKQFTLLLALASTACTYNQASYAAEEDGNETVEATTKKESKTKSSKPAETSSLTPMLLRGGAYTAVTFAGALFYLKGWAKMLEWQLFTDTIQNEMVQKIILGVLLALVSVAAAYIEGMFCECEEDDKNIYNLLSRAGFYFGALGIGTLMRGLAIEKDKIFGYEGSENLKKFVNVFGFDVIFSAIVGGLGAFASSLVFTTPEKSKK